MIVLRTGTAPRYRRDGIESFLLVSARTSRSDHLTVTLVEMEAEGFQHPHSHKPEQMYYILEGSGVMSADGDEQEVEQGDCVFIPSESEHGLRNTSGCTLRYLSAASPSFTQKQCEELWPLPSLQ